MVSGHAEIECPFCKKVGVKAFHKPSYLEGKRTHILSRSGATRHRVPDSDETPGGWPLYRVV